MKNRNIALCVLFSIISCGIYGIYWMYTINEAACIANPGEWQTDGVMVILFTIITCGIYGIYWNYKMGKAFQILPYASDNSVLYLILSIVELEIVNLCLMQNDINRVAVE